MVNYEKLNWYIDTEAYLSLCQKLGGEPSWLRCLKVLCAQRPKPFHPAKLFTHQVGYSEPVKKGPHLWEYCVIGLKEADFEPDGYNLNEYDEGGNNQPAEAIPWDRLNRSWYCIPSQLYA